MDTSIIYARDPLTGNRVLQFPSSLPARPEFSNAGKAIEVRVNQYKVTSIPSQDIWQYDINFGQGDIAMGKIKAIWNSNAVKNALSNATGRKAPFLWDGNKLAWCSLKVSELKVHVNLDEEKGRKPRAIPDVANVLIRPTKSIGMAVISAYVGQGLEFDNSILEAINFLDHAMRQGPSERFTAIKRSFYPGAGAGSVGIGGGIIGIKGVYSSVRLCSPSSGPGTGLGVNVDVANGTFWESGDLLTVARNYCSERNRDKNTDRFKQLVRPVQDRGRWIQSTDFQQLLKMKKLKFRATHLSKIDPKNKKLHTIKNFSFDARFGKQGANSKTVTFPLKNFDNGQITEETISVFDYFKRKYSVEILNWDLPLVETEKDGKFPMEFCEIVPGQRYQYKLGPVETANMIKFAVTRPRDRLQAINRSVGMLGWGNDPYLNHFGIKIEPNMTSTPARLLPPPDQVFGGKQKHNPGLAGRWDLRGKKFYRSNTIPLRSWGVVVIGRSVDEPTVRNFLSAFVRAYVGHGGVVDNKVPPVYFAAGGEDYESICANARKYVGEKCRGLPPQILMFVLDQRDSFLYENLKRGMECRFGMVSQMVASRHVEKASGQYCSNVAMKFNAKLGGTTNRVAANGSDLDGMAFPAPTLFIGADVSHATPGSPQASMAALTMSMDTIACRYAAAVQTNGYRVEMITPHNIKGLMLPLFEEWRIGVAGGRMPTNIFYFRDGVSEGQHKQVLDQEVANMKAALREKYPKSEGATGNDAVDNIKWTVVICSKRHHVRFFPKEGDPTAGDRNGNTHPGTLVEKDVTHPFEYDFYLSSHSAIQGTARSTHYHVIEDQVKVPPPAFQQMIYKHCYQYMRSTTPVSLHPAVYYAHLASNRARAHEAEPASDGPRGGQKFEEGRQDAAAQGRTSHSDSQQLSTEARPLLPLGNMDTPNNDVIRALRRGMWYI